MRKKRREIGWSEGQHGATGGSDIEVALYSAALLDTRLDEVLRSFFVDDKRELDILLKGTLWDFAPKIRVAYLLGLISQEEAADLNVVREIRNDFAHGMDRPISFEDFKERIEGLETMRQFMAHPWGQHMDSQPLRERFVSTIFILDRYLRFRCLLKRLPSHPPFRYVVDGEWPWP